MWKNPARSLIGLVRCLLEFQTLWLERRAIGETVTDGFLHVTMLAHSSGMESKTKKVTVQLAMSGPESKKRDEFLLLRVIILRDLWKILFVCGAMGIIHMFIIP